MRRLKKAPKEMTRKERLSHIVNRYFFRGDGWTDESKSVIRMWEVRDDANAELIYDILAEELDRMKEEK
tara:strand:- start:2269 stop:2475 length:207 start_codon:yes stop_codon:yes gene_type:complete